MKSFSVSTKNVSALMVTLFLLSTLTLKSSNQFVKAEPGTITVPLDYEKIQWAVGNATAGDTIFVLNGTYYEHLIIDKTLALIGESKEDTVIDGSGENRTVIEITANNVLIRGFTVQNSSQATGTSYAGIRLSGGAANITGNIVTETRIGIFVTSQQNRITENILKNNGHGIALHSSSEVTVEANIAHSNTVGISLAISSNNMILKNEIANSSVGGHGIILSTGSFNNTVHSNELLYNYHGMWLSDSYDNLISNNTIAGNQLLGIELANSPSNVFYHNDFINNPKHIVIDGRSTSTWDNGYPSGGNFWHGYISVDEKSGPDQDQPGSDGIWDNPYIIDQNNTDRYPSVKAHGEIQDIGPPVTSHNYDNLWHTKDFNIILTATDDFSGVAETYYRINAGQTKRLSVDGQPSITTEGRNNTLEYWSIDRADREEGHRILTEIKLDKTAPDGSITINNGDDYTTSLSVILMLSATDATSGVASMRFSNDNITWTPWETYNNSKNWTLTGDNGTKTVYAQYLDNAGLISSTCQDTIVVGTRETHGFEPFPEIIAAALVLGTLVMATLFLKRRTRKRPRKKRSRNQH